MGRHRRSAPQTPGHPPAVPAAAAPPTRERTDPGPPYEPDDPQDRHGGAGRAGRGRAKAPVRTGLLGASAAMAMGVVAVASGLFSGGDTLQLGGGSGPGGPGGQVRAEEPSFEVPSADSPAAAAPAPERARPPVRREAGRTGNDYAPQGAPASPVPQAPPDAPAEQPRSDHGGVSGTAPEPEAPPVTAPSSDPVGSVVAAGTDTVRAAQPRPADFTASPLSQVLTLVNQERAKAGLRPLKASTRLSTLAQRFSEDMARRGFFAHTDPEGRTPWDRAAKRGIGNLGGENIARGHPDARAVMDAWMRSAGHRANILNREYRTLGLGLSSGRGGPWWTQDFGY
ncbi:CAP domain-containing protein [Streptomyces stramineus]|uniref:CAP domain-containing protein n=1 Tax=Streptomyces stramineus TaxID=173861 RepID=A0ABP3L6B4_9ACTN